MNISLENKHAIICGSTQGIGKAAAIELASLGATVTLIARNENELKKICAELPKAFSQKHDYICADFSEPEDLKKKVEKYIGETEENPVHILVNNTGGPKGGPITEAKPEEFIDTFNRHLVCNHILVQTVLGGMKKEKYGRIINIISTSVKQPIKGLGVSNTIRAAVANWAKTLAGEVAHYGITVNNILPGSTDTDRMAEIVAGKAEKFGKSKETVIAEEISHIPAGRFGMPEELAQAIAFLA